MNQKILLVYANPFDGDISPVEPYGLEIIKDSLSALPVEVKIIDPFMASVRPYSYARQIIKKFKPGIVGISIRNFDDGVPIRSLSPLSKCQSIDTISYFPRIKKLIHAIEDTAINAIIVLGGSAFSANPEGVLRYFNQKLGVVGPGESSFRQLVHRTCLSQEEKTKNILESFLDIPGIFYLHSDGEIFIGPNITSLEDSEAGHTTRWTAYSYLRNIGALAGFSIRTKWGCSLKCSYCMESAYSGKILYRPVNNVMIEVKKLVEDYGKIKLFITDGECNLPDETHILKFSDALISSNLSTDVEWTGYFNAFPISEKLASRLRESGCKMVYLTVDSFCDRVLSKIGKNFQRKDIEKTLAVLSQYEIKPIIMLIFGTPGETEKSIDFSAQNMIRFSEIYSLDYRESYGARVYPGTPLAEYVRKHGFKNVYGHKSRDFILPLVYCAPFSPRRLAEFLESKLSKVPQLISLKKESRQELRKNERYVYHLYRGYFLFSSNEIQMAKQAIIRAQAYNSTAIHGWMLFAHILLNEGNYVSAKQYYNRILRKLSPQKDSLNLLARVHNNLAVVYLSTKNYKAAKNHLELAMEYNPGLISAKRNFELLSKAGWLTS